MSQCHDYVNVHITKSQVLVTIPGDTSDESLEEGEDCHNNMDDEDDAYCDRMIVTMTITMVKNIIDYNTLISNIEKV